VDDIDRMALESASKIPSGLISPADIQDFIICRSDNPASAVSEVDEWVRSKQREIGRYHSTGDRKSHGDDTSSVQDHDLPADASLKSSPGSSYYDCGGEQVDSGESQQVSGAWIA
jgi:hypothetical protein